MGAAAGSRLELAGSWNAVERITTHWGPRGRARGASSLLLELPFAISAGFDLVENAALFSIRCSPRTATGPYSAIARGCAQAKFALPGVDLLYLLIWLGTRAVRVAEP